MVVFQTLLSSLYLEGLPGIVQHLVCYQDVSLDLLHVAVV